jgi:sugar lactone lactonase YvrE
VIFAKKNLLNLVSTFVVGIILAFAIAFLLTINQPLLAQSNNTNQPQQGTLEVVAELPIRPWNHSVTRDGRIFATVVRSTREQPALVEITGRNSYKPFPNEAWNATFGSSPDVLNCPHGIQIDEQNRLWVIDRGSWTIIPDNGRSPLPDQPPKLLAFDINTGKLVYRFDFSSDIAPTSRSVLQDIAVDERNGFVYVADATNQLPPALVAVDLERKTVRRFEAHPSLQAEDIDLVVEGKVLSRPDASGKLVPVRIGINPISLSSDRETLYYGAMTGTSLWSIRAKLFREGATDEAIADAIERVGAKPVSDGISTDTEGNHYITNLKNNAIDVLTPDGKLSQLVRDNRLIWSDSLSFGEPSWLYVALNQLNRSLLLNPKTDEGKQPYLIVRIWTGTQGIPGR